jgi:hypothetical protein
MNSASTAVTTPPTSWISPVPTMFRIPSASDMIREIRIPDFVESKYETGRRSTCSSTRFLISVIARCAATPRICESAKDMPACTSVAPIAAMASRGRRS